MLYPRATIFGLADLSDPRPAWMFVGAWIVLQIVHVTFGEQEHVAWVAHLGGIVAGLILTPMFAPSGAARLPRRTPRPPPNEPGPSA